MWERSDTLQDTINSSWGGAERAMSMAEVSSKLSGLQRSLRVWSKRYFGSVVKNTAALRKKLEVLWNQRPSAERDKNIKRVSWDLDEVLHREEIMWSQRFRATWLREGDKNTKYFHRKATWRRKKNTTSKLKDENGTSVEKKEEFKEMTNAIFNQLFSKDEGVVPHELIDILAERVNDDMNNILKNEFSEKEVSDALFQIGPLKVPGSDGFPSRLFQKQMGYSKRGYCESGTKVF